MNNHAEKKYDYQRKGIGTIIVKHGLEVAKSLGFTACMTCGNPAIYQGKWVSGIIVSLISKRTTVWKTLTNTYLLLNLSREGFDGTNRLLSFKYYDFSTTNSETEEK